MVSPLTISGTMIMASGSLGVPGIWMERGSAIASLARTASPWSMTQPVMPGPNGLS